MNLKKFDFHEGKLSLQVFNEEFDLKERIFGIYGHTPFTFRMPNTRTIIIEYETIPLAQISGQIVYEDEKRFAALVMKPLNDFPLPDAVTDRVQRAARAVADKVEYALGMRQARHAALENYVHEMTGPSAARKARVALDMPDVHEKLKAFLFPGITEAVLPDRFEISDILWERRAVVVHMSAYDADRLISIPVLRLENTDSVSVLGPGDRRAAKDVFAETLLDMAWQISQDITASESFLRDARKVIKDQRETCATVLPALNKTAERYVSLRTSQRFSRKPEFTKRVDLGNGFELRFCPSEGGSPDMYQISHDGQTFYDTTAGGAPGYDTKLFEALIPSLTLRAVSLNLDFLSTTNIRTVMADRTARPEMNAVIQRLLDGDEDDPRVDVYL